MPIRKKDRTLQNIVRETNINEIPLDYIERLILVLANGDRVIFEGEDLQDVEEPNIVLFILSAVEELGEDYGSPVNDVEIVMDYVKLEKEISTLTKNLLDKDKDDQSNTSV